MSLPLGVGSSSTRTILQREIVAAAMIKGGSGDARCGGVQIQPGLEQGLDDERLADMFIYAVGHQHEHLLQALSLAIPSSYTARATESWRARFVPIEWLEATRQTPLPGVP